MNTRDFIEAVLEEDPTYLSDKGIEIIWVDREEWFHESWVVVEDDHPNKEMVLYIGTHDYYGNRFSCGGTNIGVLFNWIYEAGRTKGSGDTAKRLTDKFTNNLLELLK